MSDERPVCVGIEVDLCEDGPVPIGWCVAAPKWEIRSTLNIAVARHACDEHLPDALRDELSFTYWVSDIERQAEAFEKAATQQPLSATVPAWAIDEEPF